MLGRTDGQGSKAGAKVTVSITFWNWNQSSAEAVKIMNVLLFILG